MSDAQQSRMLGSLMAQSSETSGVLVHAAGRPTYPGYAPVSHAPAWHLVSLFVCGDVVLAVSMKRIIAFIPSYTLRISLTNSANEHSLPNKEPQV